MIGIPAEKINITVIERTRLDPIFIANYVRLLSNDTLLEHDDPYFIENINISLSHSILLIHVASGANHELVNAVMQALPEELYSRSHVIYAINRLLYQNPSILLEIESELTFIANQIYRDNTPNKTNSLISSKGRTLKNFRHLKHLNAYFDSQVPTVGELLEIQELFYFFLEKNASLLDEFKETTVEEIIQIQNHRTTDNLADEDTETLNQIIYHHNYLEAYSKLTEILFSSVFVNFDLKLKDFHLDIIQTQSICQTLISLNHKYQQEGEECLRISDISILLQFIYFSSIAAIFDTIQISQVLDRTIRSPDNQAEAITTDTAWDQFILNLSKYFLIGKPLMWGSLELDAFYTNEKNALMPRDFVQYATLSQTNPPTVIIKHLESMSSYFSAIMQLSQNARIIEIYNRKLIDIQNIVSKEVASWAKYSSIVEFLNAFLRDSTYDTLELGKKKSQL